MMRPELARAAAAQGLALQRHGPGQPILPKLADITNKPNYLHLDDHPCQHCGVCLSIWSTIYCIWSLGVGTYQHLGLCANSC